jgi:hypothetical protein
MASRSSSGECPLESMYILWYEIESVQERNRAREGEAGD